MHLTSTQRAHILERFRANPKANVTAHADVWSRRLYAPMYVHDAELTTLRDAVADAYPEYAIAFDVVFESAGGVVDWHCDYESLGPFDVPDRRAAIAQRHFLSVHVNLTPNGGALRTLDGWELLSYLHYVVIVACGIFSWAHVWLVWLSTPIFYWCAHAHPHAAGVANVFDNTRLHAVTAGAPRTSYVLRLVHKEHVHLTRASVASGVARSSACAAFARLLPLFDDEQRLRASDVEWAALFREP